MDAIDCGGVGSPAWRQKTLLGLTRLRCTGASGQSCLDCQNAKSGAVDRLRMGGLKKAAFGPMVGPGFPFHIGGASVAVQGVAKETGLAQLSDFCEGLLHLCRRGDRCWRLAPCVGHGMFVNCEHESS